MYCAIIGDIIHSKDIVDRAEVQVILKELLDTVNRKYEDIIAADFIITLGDEFQGLLKTSKNLLDIVEYIKRGIYPIKLRFGIGVGDVNTLINREMAIGADGPAYYHAREAISEIKKMETQYEKPYQDIRYHLGDAKLSKVNDLINATLSTIGYIENKWTYKQREVIALILNEALSQKDVATRLGLENSSVQRRLNFAGYYTYLYAFNSVNSMIDEVWEVGRDE